jgi:hypothetical protein
MVGIGTFTWSQRFLERTTTRRFLVGNHNKVSNKVPVMLSEVVCLLWKKVVFLPKELIKSHYVTRIFW